VLFLLSIASEDQRSAGIGDALCTVDATSSKAAFIAGHVKPFPRGTLPCVAFTSLARAVRTQVQREAMVDWMLSQGAEIDHAGAGYSALMGAASTQDVSMLKFLLARGAKPNAANAHGLTAIGAAVGSCVPGGPTAETERRMQPQVDVVEELLLAGADTSIYTPEFIRTRVPLLAECCNRAPMALGQKRICEAFRM